MHGCLFTRSHFFFFQVVVELQRSMADKFQRNPVSITGVKVGFKLPDGNKIEHVFSSASKVKVRMDDV